MEERDGIITDILNRTYELIEQDRAEEAYELISGMVAKHPEYADARFQAELKLVLKNMEYKKALKEFAFLRSLSLVYKYCEQHYQQAGREGMEAYEAQALPDSDVIWWCWLQGLEKAPDIVRCCLESIKSLGKKIVLLDGSNIEEYVSLPGHIEEKYEKGIISNAHYTDLVRLELLTKRGGLWIDATTYITGTDIILPILDAEDIFLYRAGNVSEYIIFDNWFMQAKRKSRILEATKNMLYAYYEKEETVKNYFLFHLMMTLACRMYPEEYRSIPLFSNEPSHVLQHEMMSPYSEKRWKQIKAMSDVHKLTYKYEEKEEKDTFLNKLLEKKG